MSQTRRPVETWYTSLVTAFPTLLRNGTSPLSPRLPKIRDPGRRWDASHSLTASDTVC